MLEDHTQRAEAVMSLQQYVSETLKYIDAVQKFSNWQASEWRVVMEKELSTLKTIPELKKKDDQQKTLSTVLKKTLEGVEKLTCFLEDVEKLAVTSLQVFTGGEEVVKLSLGFSLESVEDIILAARLVCPLLLCFKRDAEVYFRPSLHNVAIFEVELERYIDTTTKICTIMEKSSAVGFEDGQVKSPQVQLAKNLTSDVVQNISSHVNQLSDIREDKDFRLVFLFQDESVSGFVDQFSECRPRMRRFLIEMEGCAVQLDRMKKGSKISSVAGSSVGAVGGVMGLVGLLLAPVTAGASLGLTYVGLGLGVTSGVNCAVTTVTEVVVNEVQKKRASEGLQSFMKDVEKIQVRLDQVIDQVERKLGTGYWDIAKASGSVVKTSVGIGCAFRTIGGVRLAARIPGIAEQAAMGTRAMTRMAVGIGLNVLFIGLDIYTICTDSISLASRKQSEASEFIRARAALLRSEVDCWTRIHDSVRTGKKQFESREKVLQSSFRNQL